MELRSGKNKQGRSGANENSGQRAISSPQDIEDGVISTQTVTWNPFSILPKEIYLKIFGELDNGCDKQNFMNAHIKFYDLFKSQRVLFLFEEVRNACDLPKKELLDIVEEKKLLGELNDLKCRLVCRDWDRAIQKYFELHNSFFVLAKNDQGPPIDPNNIPAFPCKLIEQLKFYERHPPLWNSINLTKSIHPSLTPNCSGNETIGLFEIQNLFKNAIGTVLETHGKHILYGYMTIDSGDDLDEWNLVAEWFNLLPELRTLELNSETTLRRDQKDIENMQLVQSKWDNLLVLKSSGIPALAFNKLFKNLPKLGKIAIRIENGKESFLKQLVFPTKREN